MLEPLPQDVCPMPEMLRTGYLATEPELRKAADPILLEHRDFMYEEVIGLPLDF